MLVRPRQNGRHFAADIFKCIFFNENVWISIKISPKFVPKGPINNIPAHVQIMAWCRPGNKPLSEPMMDKLPAYICVTRHQWVKAFELNGRHFTGRHFQADAIRAEPLIWQTLSEKQRYHEMKVRCIKKTAVLKYERQHKWVRYSMSKQMFRTSLTISNNQYSAGWGLVSSICVIWQQPNTWDY